MCQATDKQIIEVLKMETIPALGCTEPVACALACARCKEELGGVPEHIEVFVSGNIYKNGMGVGIPGTGMTGLPIAAALGAVCGKTEYGLEVLKEVSACNNLAVAKSLLDKQAVVIHLKEDAPDKLYAEAICKKGNDTVKTVIVHGHTNIILVEKTAVIVVNVAVEFGSGACAAACHAVHYGDYAIVFFGGFRQKIRAVNISSAAPLSDDSDVQESSFFVGIHKTFPFVSELRPLTAFFIRFSRRCPYRSIKWRADACA